MIFPLFFFGRSGSEKHYCFPYHKFLSKNWFLSKVSIVFLITNFLITEFSNSSIINIQFCRLEIPITGNHLIHGHSMTIISPSIRVNRYLQRNQLYNRMVNAKRRDRHYSDSLTISIVSCFLCVLNLWIWLSIDYQ